MADDRYISQVRLPDGSIYKIGGEPFTYNNTVAGDADESQQPLAYDIRKNTFVIYSDGIDDEFHLMTVGCYRHELAFYDKMVRHWGMAFYIGDSGTKISPKKGTLMQQYCYEGYSAEFINSHNGGISLGNLIVGNNGDCWLVIARAGADINCLLYDSRNLNFYNWDPNTEFIHIGHYILEDAYIQDKGYRFRLNIDLSNHRFLRFNGTNQIGIAYIDNMPIHFDSGGGYGENMIETKYSELVNLRGGCKLTPGTWYRITDYRTVARSSNGSIAVANHPFDIIVRADSSCELNENAYAIRNKDDNYFKRSNLGAWELKYCLDNDWERFYWADPSLGAGVIYWMKDEFGNEAPYDFKNILFKRCQSGPINGFAPGAIQWTNVNNDKIIDMQTLENNIYKDRALCMPSTTYTEMPVLIKTDNSKDAFYYTFSYVDKPAPGVTDVRDYTLSGIASNNRIIPYMIEEVGGGLEGTARMKLPNNVCIAMQKETKSPIFNDLTFSNCYGNTLILEGQTSLYKSEFNDCSYNIFCCIEGKNEEFDKLSNVDHTVMIGLGMNNVFDCITGALLMPGCGSTESVDYSKFSYISTGASICGPVVYCDIQNLQNNSMIYDTQQCVTDNGQKTECLIYLRSKYFSNYRYPRTIHGVFNGNSVIDFIDTSTNLPYQDWIMAYCDAGAVRYWRPS